MALPQLYDARALRIVLLGDAATAAHCYALVSVVHSLWRPIRGEFDDYIANPKPTGYQSLHTVSGRGHIVERVSMWGGGGVGGRVSGALGTLHRQP